LTAAACAGSASQQQAQNQAAGTYVLKAADSLPAAVKTIKDSGKLKIGTKFDQPLTGLKNAGTGKYEGFDTELGRLIAQRIWGPDNVESHIEWVDTASKNREEFIKTGKIDIMLGTYTITAGRKQILDFAGPYFMAHQDILVPKNDNTIKTVQDLSGKKVCMATGSNSIGNMQRINPQADVSAPLGGYGDCAEAVKNGQYAAVSTDNVILYGFVSKSPNAFKVLNQSLTDEPYGVGMKKDSTDLRPFVNTVLEEIFKNGDWKKAFDKTIGTSGMPFPAPPALDKY
jgi:glutamate transport system substrate-binding protein